MTKRLNLYVYILLTLFFISVTSAIVFADETDPMFPKHNFSIGLVTEYFDYSEPDFNINVDGFMYGLCGDYTYHSKSKLMLSANFTFSMGQLDYDGQTWGGVPVKRNTDDYIIELRGLAGYTYKFNGRNGITPYVGMGYRYWNDDIDSIGGYEREIRYVYLPIGIRTISSLGADWTWGAVLEYDLFLNGAVKSHLSDVTVGSNDPENDQDFGDGYGFRLSLQFNKKILKDKNIAIEPYYKYWHVDESDTARLTYYGSPAGYVIEPENDTKSFGVRFGYRF